MRYNDCTERAEPRSFQGLDRQGLGLRRSDRVVGGALSGQEKQRVEEMAETALAAMDQHCCQRNVTRNRRVGWERTSSAGGKLSARGLDLDGIPSVPSCAGREEHCAIGYARTCVATGLACGSHMNSDVAARYGGSC